MVHDAVESITPGICSLTRTKCRSVQLDRLFSLVSRDNCKYIGRDMVHRLSILDLAVRLVNGGHVSYALLYVHFVKKTFWSCMVL